MKGEREKQNCIDYSLSVHLRDRQQSYMHAINKIIFELGKKKVIDDQKKYKESRKNKIKNAFGFMSQIEDIYDTQITNLRERAKQDKNGLLKDV